MYKVRKGLLFIGILFMVMLVWQPYIIKAGEPVIAQAATIKINKRKKTLKVGQTFQLKVSGTSQKVKWYSSNKDIAAVNATGKVTAKSEGTAVIKAEIGKKSFHCMITVKKKGKETLTSKNENNTSDDATDNDTANNANTTNGNDSNLNNTGNTSNSGTSSDTTTNNTSKVHTHQPCFVDIEKYYIELVKGESIQMNLYTNCGPLYFVESNPSIATLKVESKHDIHYPMVITANGTGMTTIGVINISDSSLTKWIAVYVKE